MLVKEMANEKKGHVNGSKIIVPCKILKTNAALHVNLLSNAARSRNKGAFGARQPSDFCRVCSAEFHVKYGIPESKRDYRPSTENLFWPSQRKECFGVILADVCRSVGITVDESKTYSDRVCTPFARKIRNLGNLYRIQSAFKLSESSESKLKKKEVPSSPSGAQQSKRLLDSPAGKSSCRKAVRVTSSTAPGKVSRKSLKFGQQKPRTTTDSFLNIDDRPKGEFYMKVLLVSPSENVTVRTPRDENSWSLCSSLNDLLNPRSARISSTF